MVSALHGAEGNRLGTTRVRIESGPVRVFAAAVEDDSPSYKEDGAIVPPTFPFSWGYWERSTARRRDSPIDKLRGAGRMILHGEQEFVYHR
jgi:hypothetical protein